MTQRLKHTFEKLKKQNASALVGFVTAGDPNPTESLNIILAMCDAGLDVLELGIPFSDPTADGPVIQRSSARALTRGGNVSAVLDLTRRLRNRIQIPIILFTYYNPILAYGIRPFYEDAASSGADGILVVDLPPEESHEMTAMAPADPLPLIRLIAPTTPPERMGMIARDGAGFLYMVSKTGVTGSGGLDTNEIRHQLKALRTVTSLPVCVGFGISTPADVASVSAIADGVVVGSAFERLIEENLGNPELPSRMGRKVAEFKAATLKNSGLRTEG